MLNHFTEVMITLYKYCPECGSELEIRFLEEKERDYCPACEVIHYHNPVPSVAAVITDGAGRLLLTKRAAEPGIGNWCLPGGFIEMGEDPLDTVVRETEEETGLKVKPGEIIGAHSKINGYHGDVIIIGFNAEVTGGELQAGDDAEEVEYFNLNELPPIAFKSHRKFIEKKFGIKIPPRNY